VVIFQQPLQGLFDAGQAIQDRYGLTLVPGFVVFCVVLFGHYSVGRVRRASERKQEAETERFVRLSQALNQATTVEQLRELLNYHLPRAVGSGTVSGSRFR